MAIESFVRAREEEKGQEHPNLLTGSDSIAAGCGVRLASWGRRKRLRTTTEWERSGSVIDQRHWRQTKIRLV